ncbi:alpha-keto acid decarboxylase family protein [Marinobacterium rhizophilum]|uniref:Alpha-keto acid decarboxylase family protein n=1 Tax=Marinobacterium rhizophilum TaxID=420402 RepID=A0ABY5HM31_9GAMM|nr:thiamine pyrophosphate-binding protein [Marinobacterium rhizophilum]UTW13452.1 alpha-keto acid decarboxylase family protein [Marinobacterium rhizophilum]
MDTDITVARYLKLRLEQLGLKQMFGVAGNYTAPLLDTILADDNSPIRIGGNANEFCAGYAADAYGRLTGFAAAYVTYSVGAFSMLNCIAGSYVEQVPVLLINGAPTNKEDSFEKNTGLLYSHTTGYEFVDINMFRPITAAAERITNARQATYQIDSVLTAMLTAHRPGYLEICEDVWRAPCRGPVGRLESGRGDIVTVSEVDAAVAATLSKLVSARKAIVWAGIELQRYGLQDRFGRLMEVLNRTLATAQQPIHFVTSAWSKSVLSEQHPYFEGCHTLSTQEIDSLIGPDGVLLGIGANTIGKDTGSQNIRSDRTLLACQDSLFAGAGFYPAVELGAYIDRLIEALEQHGASRHLKGLRVNQVLPFKLMAGAMDSTPPLTYDNFFDALGAWLSGDDVLVVDAGFPLIGAQSVPIKAQSGFVAQAAWLSIGYSVAAATGVKCACPDKRAVVVVGDGAFHETCQAVSDHHAYGQNTVVFVLANGIYGIEQKLVNPNPFRSDSGKQDYPDPLQNAVYPYNELPAWNFSKLPEVFGGKGHKVSNLDELASVMAQIRDNPTQNYVVEIVLDKTDVPAAIAASIDTDVGEDETDNPNWPPGGIF